MEAHHLDDTRHGATPTDRYVIAPGLSGVDRGYVIRTWTDGIHRAKANYRKPISLWKPLWRERIDRILALPGTHVLVAHHATARFRIGDAYVRGGVDEGPMCLGWIVWTTGRGWPTVHYAFTRRDLGETPWRRRGVMAELVDAAALGPRVVYTHRGEYARGPLGRRLHYPRGLDEEIAAWAKGRGMAVTYMPIEEWLPPVEVR